MNGSQSKQKMDGNIMFKKMSAGILARIAVKCGSTNRFIVPLQHKHIRINKKTSNNIFE